MLDLFRFARGDAANAFDEINISAGCIERREVCGCIAEAELLTIRKHRVDCLDVMHHVAVTDGARAATIVARHAAQRRLRACGHIHGIPESMRLQICVQLIEHNTGLHTDAPRFGIERHDLIQVFAVIDDERCTNGLTAL